MCIKADISKFVRPNADVQQALGDGAVSEEEEVAAEDNDDDDSNNDDPMEPLISRGSRRTLAVGLLGLMCLGTVGAPRMFFATAIGEKPSPPPGSVDYYTPLRHRRLLQLGSPTDSPVSRHFAHVFDVSLPRLSARGKCPSAVVIVVAGGSEDVSLSVCLTCVSV